MKIWVILLALFALFMSNMALAQKSVRVKGYYRKDGTYVAPHYRSAPNSSRYDNYSTRGNYNPYTGKRGSTDPYKYPTTGSHTTNYVAPSYSPPQAHQYQTSSSQPRRFWPKMEPGYVAAYRQSSQPQSTNICSSIQSAAETLAYAAGSLARYANQMNFQDACDNESADATQAADAYRSLVAQHGGSCN